MDIEFVHNIGNLKSLKLFHIIKKSYIYKYRNLKSTCYVNLLSKLSIIFKEWRVIVLFVL